MTGESYCAGCLKVHAFDHLDAFSDEQHLKKRRLWYSRTMSARAILGPLILVAFVLVALFGLSIFASSMHDDMGCPFTPGATVLCDAVLAHLSHWQNALTFVVTELALFGAILLVRLGKFTLFDARHVRARTNLKQALPRRPTLLQELFSGGILHPKKPHLA